MFRVTRLFLNGNLAGIEHTEVTSVRFEVGKTYTPCVGKGAYKIVSCVEV